MLVSIVVPVYNVEKYLATCLDSILAQTYSNIEVFVVNDGSPDNSQKIIDEYELKDSRIKGILKENGGISDARNFALPFIKGEYVMFIDSDDTIEPTMVEEMLTKAQDDDADLVFCDIKYVFEDNHEPFVKQGFRELTDHSIKNALLSPPSAWNKLYKSSLFLDSNIKYPLGLWYEDLGTSPKLYLMCEHISYVNKPFINYLQRSGSIMATADPRNTHMFEILNSIREYYIEVGKFDVYYEELEFAYVEHLALYSNYRFLRLKNGYKEIFKVIDIMNRDFPNWKQNKYIEILREKDQFFLKRLNKVTALLALWAFKAKQILKG